MSVVTEHLEERGIAFELIPHRQAYTSTEEARALGVDAGEVLKTLAVRTSSGYALVVIPASRRLDLHLVVVQRWVASSEATIARHTRVVRSRWSRGPRRGRS